MTGGATRKVSEKWLVRTVYKAKDMDRVRSILQQPPVLFVQGALFIAQIFWSSTAVFGSKALAEGDADHIFLLIMFLRG